MLHEKLFQDYFDSDGNIYNDIPLHDLIGTVSSNSNNNSSEDTVQEFCESSIVNGRSEEVLQSVVEAPEKESSGGGGGGGVASTAKHGRWNETSSQQHQQQHLVLLSLDGSKKVKPTSAEALPAKSPSYLPSATARRAEQMLSSLGESIEMTSTDVKIFQEKGDDEKVNRKRKLNPEHDLDEVSNALADVADEFARMLEGQSSRPCYPLSTMFGLDVIGSPNKMVRLQFVARDGSNDDSSASTSPTTSTTTMMMTSKNSDDSGRRVDIDAITSLAFDGPVQSSKL